MERINFAISGCGHIAARHALAAANYGELVAVCDHNIEKAVTLAAQFNCKAYGNLTEMLAQENIDTVSICTPNYLHAPQSIECLQKGFHVVCEKPMAITGNDAEAMIHASKTSSKELFIVKQMRYYPHLLFIKQLLNAGTLGKVYSFHINCFWNRPDAYYKDWKGNKEKDGGTLYTQFSHYIDLLIWFFGDVQEIQFTSGKLAHERIDFEDVGIVSFKMRNDAVGSLNYTVNAYGHNAENSITIFAENGTTKLNGAMLNNFEYFNVKNIEKLPDFVQMNTHKDQSHFKVYENVVNALTGNNHNALKAKESIASIKLIERIYNNHHA